MRDLRSVYHLAVFQAKGAQAWGAYVPWGGLGLLGERPCRCSVLRVPHVSLPTRNVGHSSRFRFTHRRLPRRLKRLLAHRFAEAGQGAARDLGVR